MKLYSVNLSQFASMVRMAIYAKALPVEITPPPGGLKSAAYLAINPLGKMPCLHLDDGASIPESLVILEYLEDAFPEPALRPAAPEAAARVRLLARLSELYVVAPLRSLFAQVDPAARDVALVGRALDELDAGLGCLEGFIGADGFAAGGRFSIADCQILPTLFYVAAMGPAFGRPDLLSRRPKLDAYFASASRHPAAARVLDELKSALAHYRATGQIS